MTGWDESELIGKTAPFVYWPEEDRDYLVARLEDDGAQWRLLDAAGVELARCGLLVVAAANATASLLAQLS